MSRGILYLHSHSALERELQPTAKDKFHVLVDKKYAPLFEDCTTDITPFTYNGVEYIKVPTFSFFKKGGVFKNLRA
jgi:hypothetical protein